MIGIDAFDYSIEQPFGDPKRLSQSQGMRSYNHAPTRPLRS